MRWKPRPCVRTNKGVRLVFSAVAFTTSILLTQFFGQALAKDASIDSDRDANSQSIRLAAGDSSSVSSETSTSTTTESESPVKTAISETARNYESAFRNGDSAGLAQMWAENGTYVDSDGNTFNGRAEIEKVFQNYFKIKDSAKNIEIVIDTVKPIGTKGAVEKGVAKIKDVNGKLLSAAPYTVIHVNNDGKWEMASVTEEPALYFDNALEKLRWLLGEWSGKGSEGEATLSTRWMADQHFLIAIFRVKSNDGDRHEDTQIIGVDPRSRKIVSYLFDSEGGFGRGVWSTDGKTWAIDMVRRSSEGRRIKSRSLLQPKDSDVFVWKTTGRSLDGLLIPDSETITVNRIHL